MLKYAVVGGAVSFLLITAGANSNPPDKQVGPAPLLTLRGHAKAVSTVEFSPDGVRLASVGMDHDLLLWDAKTGKRLLTLKSQFCGLHTIVSFSPDGKYLAAPASSPSLKVWYTAVGRARFALGGHEDFPLLAAFSPGGQHLATVDWPSPEWCGAVQIRDARTGARRATLRNAAEISSLAYSPDGRRLATGGREGTVTVWEMGSGSTALTLKGEDEVLRVAFSPDRRKLAAGSFNSVRVWALPSGRECWTLGGHDAFPVRLMFSSDDRWLASAWTRIRLERLPNGDGMPRFYGGEVIVWDATTGKKRLALPAAEGEAEVFDLSFSPGGTRLATAHGDGTVRVWSVKDLLGK
jgi:WD40 repeat protein